MTPAGDKVLLQLLKHAGRDTRGKLTGKDLEKNMDMSYCGSGTLDESGWEDLEGTVWTEGDTVKDCGMVLLHSSV